MAAHPKTYSQLKVEWFLGQVSGRLEVMNVDPKVQGEWNELPPHLTGYLIRDWFRCCDHETVVERLDNLVIGREVLSPVNYNFLYRACSDATPQHPLFETEVSQHSATDAKPTQEGNDE